MTTHNLDEFGYAAHWQELCAPYMERGLEPGRVVRAARGGVVVVTAAGEMLARPAAALVKAARQGALPVVGDWVALCAGAGLETPLVEAVLPRATAIVRADPGEDRQVLAANIEFVFIVHPIAAAPNLRRLERELALAWESGAVPVIVLTKADLSAAPDEALTVVAAIAPGVDVHLTSAPGGAGLEALARLLGRRTAALIGPSGAGKSTLVNALLGEERQATRAVRVSDGRGRHTTVSRELVLLPDGGMLVDSPGLRALALTGGEAGIEVAFADIAALGIHCRFRDCAHDGEPGCAVAAAVIAGSLPEERLMSYHKLVREARVAAARTDVRLRHEEQQKWKGISKARKNYRRVGRG